MKNPVGLGDKKSRTTVQFRKNVWKKYWEIIADNLSKAGWSWGCSSQIDASGRVLYTADAYRNDGKRFTVIADDKVTAFLELEKVTRE